MEPVCLGSCEIDEKSWDDGMETSGCDLTLNFTFIIHYDYDDDYNDSLPMQQR